MLMTLIIVDLWEECFIVNLSLKVGLILCNSIRSVGPVNNIRVIPAFSALSPKGYKNLFMYRIKKHV